MNYIKLFSNCIIVKGFSQSLISDNQRCFSETIPNDLVEIIEKLNNKRSIAEVFEEYGMNNKVALQEYIEFLIKKQYCFYCDEDEFDMFPDMNLVYKVPSTITNAVLELEQSKLIKINEWVYQLEYLGCSDLVLVFYESIESEDFLKIFNSLNNTRIKSLEINCIFHKKYDIHFLKNISNDISSLTRLIFTNAPYNKVDKWDNNILFDRIWLKEDIKSFKHCGVVNTKYFNTNLPKVLEAINHNSCLNRKISIDVNGDIKNCPSMPESYGNIKDTTLEEAINKPGFKKYWNITKDDIEVCRDCEFRYICTDCRAYTERTKFSDEGLDLSKPLKCGYNPYTNEWAEWSTNPLKEKAIEYYGMKEIIENDKK